MLPTFLSSKVSTSQTYKCKHADLPKIAVLPMKEGILLLVKGSLVDMVDDLLNNVN
jgi:hypothetical protein